MPKAELHLHLEGSINSTTLIKLAKRNNSEFPYQTTEEIENALANRPPGLQGFLDHHYERVLVLQKQLDFFETTYELVKTCKVNNIKYLELFFDPQFHTARGISFDDIIMGIDEGRKKGFLDFGVEVNLIMCINRERTISSGFEMLEQAKPHKDKIIGLGLDSYEENNPPHKYTDVYAQAKKEGYRLTAHCDVDMKNSTRNIWECLEILDVERIDHGINSIEDPKLVQELVRRKICLTTCPIKRPCDPQPQDIDRIREMVNLGLCVTLNTDDPPEFETGYLSNLLYLVQQASHYSKNDMVQFMRNAFDGSWLQMDAKNKYIEALLEYAESHGVN
ncbi:MAG: adenosine deaminase [Deltaproteobacteria bacterium]|nr:adenosine deaminase [Deltaproteobacteria bacterium]